MFKSKMYKSQIQTLHFSRKLFCKPFISHVTVTFTNKLWRITNIPDPIWQHETKGYSFEPCGETETDKQSIQTHRHLKIQTKCSRPFHRWFQDWQLSSANSHCPFPASASESPTPLLSHLSPSSHQAPYLHKKNTQSEWWSCELGVQKRKPDGKNLYSLWSKRPKENPNPQKLWNKTSLT